MANYPRTEAQMAKRLDNVKARISKNAHKVKLMDRCMDLRPHRELADMVGKDYCDVSREETPDSVPDKREDLNSKEEAENFKVELERVNQISRDENYNNRLDRINNYTGMTISGKEDAKREVLDGGVERVLLRAADVKAENLKGVYVGDSNERIGSIRSSFGMDVRRGQDRGFDEDNAEKLSGPRYDPGTKQIYLPRGKVRGLSNKIGHEIGHAKIDEWGSVGINDAGLGESFNPNPRGKMQSPGSAIFGDISDDYEEISADILMKERYGDHLAKNAIREQFGTNFGGVSGLVTESIGRICSYRAKAEIFGLSDIKNKIDSELKSQHGIDVASPSDSIGRGIKNLTNAYCDLQGLNRDKFKSSFKNIARMSLGVDGYNVPPDS